MDKSLHVIMFQIVISLKIKINFIWRSGIRKSSENVTILKSIFFEGFLCTYLFFFLFFLFFVKIPTDLGHLFMTCILIYPEFLYNKNKFEFFYAAW